MAVRRATRYLTDNEIQDRLRMTATLLGVLRSGGPFRQTPDQELGDQFLAEVHFASEVLDGKVNFAGRIGPESYWRLEHRWLCEVKRLRAYFLWERRGAGFDARLQEADYLGVCEHLLEMLTNRGIKGQPVEFSPIRTHVENSYLKCGKVSLAEPATQNLINCKAKRLWEQEGRPYGQAESHWAQAETYVRTFYERIIPAVADGDKECAGIILKVLDHDDVRPAQSSIVNCFEAALALYFLDAEVANDYVKQKQKRDGKSHRNNQLNRLVSF